MSERLNILRFNAVWCILSETFKELLWFTWKVVLDQTTITGWFKTSMNNKTSVFCRAPSHSLTILLSANLSLCGHAVTPYLDYRNDPNIIEKHLSDASDRLGFRGLWNYSFGHFGILIFLVLCFQTGNWHMWQNDDISKLVMFFLDTARETIMKLFWSAHFSRVAESKVVISYLFCLNRMKTKVTWEH